MTFVIPFARMSLSVAIDAAAHAEQEMTISNAATMILTHVHGGATPTMKQLRQLVEATRVLNAAKVNTLDIEALAAAEKSGK